MENGRELLLSTLRGAGGDQVPWVPFAGVHAGKLAGYTATEVLTDGDKLLESLLLVNRLYRPHGQPVLFDLQVEAEILGCELMWSDDTPPSVKTHPLAGVQGLPSDLPLPGPEDGRLPMILDVMGRLKQAVGDETALYGLICGPFTLASHLRGNDIFMDMFDDEDYVRDLLSYCETVGERVAGYYLEAGMDVVAVVDPLVSQISSDHFEVFLSEPFTKLFGFIRAQGALSSFFVCGNATRNIEPMCKTAPDSISVDENVDLPAAKRLTDRYGITICGNIPLTTIMLHGTQQDNMRYVAALMEQVGSLRGLVIAPGCDMPYATPVENAIAVAQAVREPEAVGEMLRNYVAAEEDIQVDLPDYDRLERPLVEVFTLDSATCAACTYMMGAAFDIKARYGDAIDLVEYKYTVKENIARCKKMGVANLPSLYINGQLRFSSLIPSREVLCRCVEAALS